MATTKQKLIAKARAGQEKPLAQRIVNRYGNPTGKVGSLRDFQAPPGRGRSFGSALGLIDKALGAGALVKGLAGATTGMHSVRNPGDLAGRAGGAVAAGASVTPLKGVAITTKMTQLRKALGLGNSARDAALAREFAEYADLPMVPMQRDIRALLEQVAAPAQRGQVQPGGIYRVPAKSRHGEFVQDRTAILQDPETGTMFVAPGVLHDDVARAVEELLPNYRGRVARDWLQHEVYGPHPGYGPAGTREPIPARMMFSGIPGNSGFGEPIRDTESATIARAQLLKNLQKLGVLGDMKKAEARRAAMLKARKRR